MMSSLLALLLLLMSWVFMRLLLKLLVIPMSLLLAPTSSGCRFVASYSSLYSVFCIQSTTNKRLAVQAVYMFMLYAIDATRP
jgi:hypothetical protein